jgi:hypothetical protein
MRISKTSAIVTLVSLALVSSAAAQCCSGAKKTADGGATCQKDKSTCSKTGDMAGKEGCKDKALAASGMPVMHYKVGEKTTCCPKAAAEMAKADDATIKYVVNETEYTNNSEALQAYAKVLDEYLGTLTSVRYAVGDKCVNCPMAAAALAKDSGETVKYRVASFTFADKAAADKAADAARTASEKVEMTMVVDGQETKCDAAAKATCHKSADDATASKTCDKSAHDATAKKTCDKSADGATAAKTCEYRVGDTKTCCAATAKVELAKARIETAQKALEEIAAKDTSGKEVASGV